MRNKLIRKVVTLTLAAVMVVSSGAAVFGRQRRCCLKGAQECRNNKISSVGA